VVVNGTFKVANLLLRVSVSQMTTDMLRLSKSQLDSILIHDI